MTKDWYAEYMLALNEICKLRGALAFIEGFTRESLKHAESITEAHMRVINNRVKAALEGGNKNDRQ